MTKMMKRLSQQVRLHANDWKLCNFEAAAYLLQRPNELPRPKRFSYLKFPDCCIPGENLE